MLWQRQGCSKGQRSLQPATAWCSQGFQPSSCPAALCRTAKDALWRHRAPARGFPDHTCRSAACPRAAGGGCPTAAKAGSRPPAGQEVLCSCAKSKQAVMDGRRRQVSSWPATAHKTSGGHLKLHALYPPVACPQLAFSTLELSRRHERCAPSAQQPGYDYDGNMVCRFGCLEALPADPPSCCACLLLCL